MELLTPKYIPDYAKRQRLTLEKHLARLARKGARAGDATRWATIAGAVASSQIEGSRVTVDEYVEATSNGARRTRDVQEVEDLVQVLPGVKAPRIEAFFVYPEEMRHSKRVAVFRDFLMAELVNAGG